MEYIPKSIEPFSPGSEVDENIKNDILFKVILIGESGVGKTNLFSRYMKNEYNENATATVGFEFSAKNFEVDKKIVKVQLWDTAGQERFWAMSRQYYRGAMGGVVVYDITSLKSFEKCEKWIEEIRASSANPHIVILLVGNKCDLDKEGLRQVSTKQAKEFSKQQGINFLETSACSNTNVQKAFQMILQEIYQTGRTHGITNVSENPYAVPPEQDFDEGETITLKQVEDDVPQNPSQPGCSC